MSDVRLGPEPFLDQIVFLQAVDTPTACRDRRVTGLAEFFAGRGVRPS
ncbi:MAG: hypothetical protein V5A18_03805 [Haloarculaceae archaeon]